VSTELGTADGEARRFRLAIRTTRSDRPGRNARRRDQRKRKYVVGEHHHGSITVGTLIRSKRQVTAAASRMDHAPGNIFITEASPNASHSSFDRE